MTETNFKHTDLSLIPHDWEVKTLRSIIDECNYGVGAEAIKYNGDVKYLRITDIDDESHHYSPKPLTSPAFYSECHLAKSGDLFVARTGASVGKSYLYNSKDGKLVYAGFLIKVHISEANPYCVFLNTLTQRYNNWVISESARTGQPGLNAEQLKTLLIPLPPTLAEQERIAGALSSIDTLIGALTEQIEKKRHIKQGAMQQLLTGKKRLAGFTGEWKSVKLSEICDFAKGKGLKKEYLTDSGQYRCILYGEIFTKYDGIIKSVVSRTDVYEGTLSKKGDILMPGSTTTIGIDLVKAVALNEDNILLGGDVIILRPKEKQACADFLAYLISNVDRNKVADVTQGITIIHLHAKNMVDIMYTIPPTIAEQSAIATVLSGMDTEIAALEQKRDKYIAIKSGMMQNLLTGKIRLA